MNPVARGMARLFDGLAAIWWLIWRAALIAALTPAVRYGGDLLFHYTPPWWAAVLIAAGIVLLPWLAVSLLG